MAECNDFSEEEHVAEESQEDMPISNDSRNGLTSDTSQNDEEREYNEIMDAHERTLQMRLNIVRSINELQDVINSLLQQKIKLVDIKKDLEKGLDNLKNDLEKTLKDSHNYFLQFRDVYKKCESALENLFQKADLRTDLSNTPGYRHENICEYFPILSSNVVAYTLNLTSAKTAFEAFKSLTESGFEQATDNKINELTTAIDKAYIAYSKLRLIVFYED